MQRLRVYLASNHILGWLDEPPGGVGLYMMNIAVMDFGHKDFGSIYILISIP